MAIGTRRIVKSATRLWTKLAAIPIALLVLQFFVYPFGSAVYTTNAAHPQVGERTPADLGYEYRDVMLVSADGTRLAAWYIPPTNDAVVIVRHGSGSTRTNALDHAAFLAEAGYGVLITDARGHGESGGEINEIGWYGPSDVDAALDYLDDVTEHVGILGLSMGGEEGLHAAAIDERIDAAVADGAGISTYEDSVSNGQHALARAVNWVQFSFTELLSDAPQPEGLVSALPKIAPRPVLLITANEANEHVMGPIYADAGGPTTELWELADTPHTDGLTRHRVAYVKRVLDVFDSALLP